MMPAPRTTVDVSLGEGDILEVCERDVEGFRLGMEGIGVLKGSGQARVKTW